MRVEAVAAGGAREGVELRLAPAGRVRVSADLDGAMAVKAEWAGGSPVPKGAATARAALLKSGRATIEGLPSGRWRLTLSGSLAVEVPGVERTVDVVAGQLAPVEF